MKVNREHKARISLNVMREGQSDLILNLTGPDNEPSVVNRHFPLLAHHVLFHRIPEGRGPAITSYPFIGSDELTDMLSKFPALECLLHDTELVFVAILPSNIFPGYEQPPVILKFENQEECMDFRRYTNYHDLLRKNGKIPRLRRRLNSSRSNKKNSHENSQEDTPLARYNLDTNRIKPTPIGQLHGDEKKPLISSRKSHEKGDTSYQSVISTAHRKEAPKKYHLSSRRSSDTTGSVTTRKRSCITISPGGSSAVRPTAVPIPLDIDTHISGPPVNTYTSFGPDIVRESQTPRDHTGENYSYMKRGIYIQSPRNLYKDSMFKYDGGTRKLPVMGQFINSDAYRHTHSATRGVQ